MDRINCPIDPKRILVAALISVFVMSVPARTQDEIDPHRPACTDAHCRKIRSFLKAHYCGESPFGNGPDDGCEIKSPERPRTGVDVVAAYDCKWNESKQAEQCEQHGQPSPVVRNILSAEMQRLGSPAKSNVYTYFTVWKSAHSGWSLAEAYYSRSVGSDLELCQVIAVIDESSHMIVLRKLPFQKTDADVPLVTLWTPVDLADAGGDGQEDVILEGDAYENHWLEVISLHGGSAKTIFSGLGYYL